MMGPDTTYRSREPEIMDDFGMEGSELHGALDKIAAINKLLGGNSITLDGVKQLLRNHDRSSPITIIDVGCGNGDMLRMLADYAKRKKLNFKLVGIDANKSTIEYARQLSTKYDMDYQCLDIFKEEFSGIKYDIALCTLTLHHFSDEEILDIMAIFNRNAALGIVVNDLHRSKLAYSLFKIVSRVLGLNKMARQDGLVSILRGFRRNELEGYSRKLNIKSYNIRWRWAFRYQWIIKKI